MEARLLDDLIVAEGRLQVGRDITEAVRFVNSLVDLGLEQWGRTDFRLGQPEEPLIERGFSIALEGTLTIPDAIAVLGGTRVEGNALASWWENTPPDQNHVSIWTTLSNPFSFLVGPETFSAGFRVGFDGSFRTLNAEEIRPTGSWDLVGDEGFVLLSAQWDGPAEDVSLIVHLPDGRRIDEADLGDFDTIAPMAALNGDSARHVMIANPEAGRWDIELTGTLVPDEIRYSASILRENPALTLALADLDPDRRLLELDYAVEGAGAGARLDVFLSDTARAEGGLRLATATLEAGDGDGQLALDLAGVAPGTYHLNGILTGDTTAPVTATLEAPVVLEGAADLRLTIEEAAVTDPALAELSIQVTNAGDRESGDGVIELELPGGLSADLGLAGDFAPVDGLRQFGFASLAPGESVTTGVALRLPDMFDNAPVRATATASGFDANESGASAVFHPGTLAQRAALLETPETLTGTVTARDGTALEGTTVTFTPDAGSPGSVQTGADGRFALPATGAGRLEASRDHGPDDPAITTASALEALRLAVGLAPSWGAAGPMDYIAADFDGDGRVTTADALEVLRVAVGLGSDHAPRWLFLDAEAELDHIDRTDTAVDPGLQLPAPETGDLALTGILLGHVQDYT